MVAALRAKADLGHIPLCVSVALALCACNAGDLSAALASGRCDSAGHCAAGYVCDQSSWQCTAASTKSSGGNTGITNTLTTGGTSSPGSSAGASASNVGGASLASGGFTTASPAGGGSRFDTAVGGSSFASGGFASGGVAAGGVSTGGVSTGGVSTGGVSTGGASAGGTSTSSVASGGDSTGGVTSGGFTSGTTALGGGFAGAGGTSAPQSTACTQDGCACGNGLVICGGTCVDLTTSIQHCGSCSNRCDLLASALVCDVSTQPGCSCAGDDSKCGNTPDTAKCVVATGVCQCNNVECVRGEICRTNSKGVPTCSCDGNATCTTAQTCCQGKGCINLSSSETDCGLCGHACPTGFRCTSSVCRCGNKVACDAGGGGECSPTGFCQCGSAICSAGQRCVAQGVCG